MLCWVAAVLLMLPQPWHQLRMQVDPSIDLHVYRDAGVSLLHHRPVYAQYTITRFNVLPFTYPPLAAILAVPLALLPFLLVRAVWDLAVYAVLAYVLRLVLVPVRGRLRAQARPGRWSWEPVVLPATWLVCGYLLPGRQQVHFGQVGVFLMALVVVDLLTPHTGRWRGVLVGLATAIKLTPGVFIVALLVAGRRRAAAVAAGTAAGLTLLAALVAPGTSRSYWTNALFDSDRLGNNADPTNQSLRGIVLRGPLHHLPATVAFVLIAAVVGAVGLRKAAIAWRSGDELAAVTVAGLLTALLSPVAWIHHYVYLFMLFALLLRDGRWRPVVALAALWWQDVPSLGHTLLAHHTLPMLDPFWQLLQDSLGLSMVVVVCWLPVRARAAVQVAQERERLEPVP